MPDPRAVGAFDCPRCGEPYVDHSGDTCRDCGVCLNADNVWEPGTCKDCVPEAGSEKWHYNFCQAGLQTIYVVMDEGHGHQIGCPLCDYRGPVIPCD